LGGVEDPSMGDFCDKLLVLISVYQPMISAIIHGFEKAGN
jgi:hypothetical protein